MLDTIARIIQELNGEEGSTDYELRLAEDAHGCWVAAIVDAENPNGPLFDPIFGEKPLRGTGHTAAAALEALTTLCREG